MNAIARAEQLAEFASGEEEQNQYLTFFLNGEMLAVPIRNIKKILEYGYLTNVPMMPEFIRGVINLRGGAVPVLDLAVRFGRKSAEITKRTCIVIVEIQSGDEKNEVGVIVDSVSEVLEIPDTEIKQAPSFGAKIRADFIHGMAKINGNFVIILAVNHVLSLGEMEMLSQFGGAELETLALA
jgi:purine-binding chemotaxis protein CheW